MTEKSNIPAGISPRLRGWGSALRYLLGKLANIWLAVFIGVFITVLITNQPPPRGMGEARSPFEITLESQIQDFIQYSVVTGAISRDANGVPDQAEIAALEQRLYEESGLNLPYLPRYFLWTLRALSFNWGELKVTYVKTIDFWEKDLSDGQGVVVEHLSNTVLLIGTAYLLTFLIALPLSLHMAQNRDGRLNRFFSALSPISSVPSWVFAVLLITVFAVQLRWFPVGGKYDILEIKNSADQVRDIARHMVLPVLSLVLALLFQIVYAWRTFFMIYSDEDYVELAKAKGLPAGVLQRRYILRPALPYVMTSLVTTVIGFWQLTVALEVIFQWPGIGWLYIKEALPNYWGETIYTGQLMIVIEIVVIFAYVLGLSVFLLDLFYVLVDPRIHLLPKDNKPGKVKSARKMRFFVTNVWAKQKAAGQAAPATGPTEPKPFVGTIWVEKVKSSFQKLREQIGFFARELGRYPSAVFGLAIICIMIAGSVYAVVALPYEKIAVDYNLSRASGKINAPRVATPAWTNIFRSEPYLSSLELDENSPQAHTTFMTLENGWVEKTVTYSFDYRYREVPSEIILYVEADYEETPPFISLVWTTPDGRSIDLKSVILTPVVYYDFTDGVKTLTLLRQNPEWRTWVVSSGSYPTPTHHMLFAAPNIERFELLKGTYQLEIKSLLFEKDSDTHPQLTLLGQVYGLAGTDYWRRDLMVPLLWGMPFALFVGLLGTSLTVVVAMFLPAIGVWYGGWLDNAIQRLTEINMVLPGLTIAVLAYALFGLNIWVVLGIVVVLNSFGSPIKNFRSALLQAKEAPYIEAARSYGASDFRIITRYLLPRILPVAIPQIVSQVPGFIFLEATLGFFNIKSLYPSWGRIIYEGLSRGAIYGSPFWVLMPISLLLLTGLAFALLGSALERVLNPRMLNQAPDLVDQRSRRTKRILAAASFVLILLISFVPLKDGKTLPRYFGDTVYPPTSSPEEKNPPIYLTALSTPASLITETPAPVPQASPTLTVTPPTTPTLEPSPQVTSTSTLPLNYTLQHGEYPYCIARRFNVDPGEMLVLNGFTENQKYFTGMILYIPQNGKPFPGARALLAHPAVYTVQKQNETIFEIACRFGDVPPERIAQLNGLPLASPLAIGQQISIP